MKKTLLTVLAAAALLGSGCGTNLANFTFTPAQAQAQTGTTTTQVEFLARPAISEGLLFTNNFLNAYNAVTPRFVAAGLADANSTEGKAIAPVLAEATTVLTLLDDPNNGLTVAQKAGAFLPDVMRIDTTLNFTADNTPSYPTFNSNSTTLVGGRKITDDVVDITLTVLSDGAVKSDGVPYYRPTTGTGSTNLAIGHSMLNGQTTEFGPATFPFLAPPK